MHMNSVPDLQAFLFSAPALVLVPHPDDEVIGVGALLASRKFHGAQTTLLWMTAGAPVHDSQDRRDFRQRAADRRKQAKGVAKLLSCSAIAGHCPSRQLHTRTGRTLRVVRKLAAAMGRGILFYPGLQRGHPDHDICWAIGRRILCEFNDLTGREYGLYGWKNRQLDFTSFPSLTEVSLRRHLSRKEQRSKECLLKIYETEYPRILHKCPLDREFYFQPCQVGLGEADGNTPGWTTWLSDPSPETIRLAMKQIIEPEQLADSVQAT